MTGQLVLGGLAVFLMIWFGLSAVAGVGHAFPFRPSLIMPGRSRSASFVLIWVVVLAMGAAVLLGERSLVAYVPFALVLLLPFWDSFSASGFKNSIVVVNATDAGVRPAIRAALQTFFGEMEEDEDVFRSAENEKEAIALEALDGRGMIVLSPQFVLQPKRRQQLEHLLKDALKTVPARGFNLAILGVAVLLPLIISGAFGWMGVMLFTTLG